MEPRLLLIPKALLTQVRYDYDYQFTTRVQFAMSALYGGHAREL